MDKKTVQHALSSVPIPKEADATKRAVELLISKNGVFRTDEKWVYSSLRSLIDAGYIHVSGNTLSIGSNFENLLLKMAESDKDYSSLLKDYRSSVLQKMEEYGVATDTVMSKIASMPNTDEKIIYLTSMLAETHGKLEYAIRKTEMLEAALREIDMSVAVLESVTFEEDSDG